MYQLIIFIVIILFFSVNVIQKTDKYTLLKSFPTQYVPTVELYDQNTDLELINYPVIFKTNECDSWGKDVKRIDNSDQALKFISDYTYEKNNIIIQEFSPYTNEVAIFIRRSITDGNVEIISAVIRDLNKNSLVNNDCPSDKCRIITDDLSSTLKNKIHEISTKINGLNWGRYDIKYESLEELMKGKFHIMELNVGPGIIPILYPMNFDLVVLWTTKDIRIIYRIIEFIISYFIISLSNIIRGQIKSNDIFMNIRKWLSKISCYL
jgi:glutathione synthase/RimK-type ligase-like ATP-grasp enzyme